MDILRRLTNEDKLDAILLKNAQKVDRIDDKELAAFLKSRVIGQDLVADEVAAQIRRRTAKRERTLPIGVFCFAGPPGVGKTYFAKVLAEKLHGTAKALLFFDMSQFSEPHAAASLFGQARGYMGSDTYGKLTAGLRDFPKSVVLLDEFEKAHTEVHKRFLTAWNDGFVTEASDGARLDTSKAIFILTTNAAAEKIGELAKRYADDRDQLVQASKALLKEAGFAPEVLSRIDHVFAFARLEGKNIARVVALEIERQVRQYSLEIVDDGIDPEILARAVERNAKAQAGGIRDLARVVEMEISEGLMTASENGSKRVRLRENEGKVIVEAVD